MIHVKIPFAMKCSSTDRYLILKFRLIFVCNFIIKVGNREGIGLKSIREKVSLFSGRFDLRGRINGGTTVSLELPLKLIKPVSSNIPEKAYNYKSSIW